MQVSFNKLPWMGEDSGKIKKGDGSMVQGQIFLKEEGTFRI